MNISQRLAAPRQRLMTLGLLAPLVLVCLSMITAVIWFQPMGLEGWALLAAAAYILNPLEIFSHLFLALAPRGPSPAQIQACLAPALREAKARLVLDGRPMDEPLDTRLAIELVGWRWHTRLTTLSRLDKSHDRKLARELERVFDARFSRFDRARIAIASFASELTLEEPLISNHVLIEVAAKRDAEASP